MTSFKTEVVGPPFRAPDVRSIASLTAVDGRQDLFDGGKQSPPQQRFDQSSADGMREAIAIVEQSLEQYAPGFRFEVDEESGRTVVTVLDRNTGEVVRRLPPDEILAIARLIAEGRGERGTGVLLDTES